MCEKVQINDSEKPLCKVDSNSKKCEIPQKNELRKRKTMQNCDIECGVESPNRKRFRPSKEKQQNPN